MRFMPVSVGRAKHVLLFVPPSAVPTMPWKEQPSFLLSTILKSLKPEWNCGNALKEVTFISAILQDFMHHLPRKMWQCPKWSYLYFYTPEEPTPDYKTYDEENQESEHCVNALKEATFISTTMKSYNLELTRNCVNALKGATLISTIRCKGVYVWLLVVSMPWKGRPSFLRICSHFSHQKRNVSMPWKGRPSFLLFHAKLCLGI